MANKTLQFHAMLEDIRELATLLLKVVPGVHIYLWLNSGELVGYSPSDTPDIDIRQTSLMVASIMSIRLPVESLDTLRQNYPGILFMDLPEMIGGALREISAGAKTWDERGADQLKAWDRFFRKLRTQLRSGAFVFMPQTGAGRYYKNAHATQRAIEAARNGLILKAMGGDAEYDYDRSRDDG